MLSNLPKFKSFCCQHPWLCVCVGVCSIGLLAGLFSRWPIGQSGPISVGTLSDRAQEFIVSEQQRGSPVWRNRASTTAETPVSDTANTIETECFLFFPTFPIRSVEKVDSKNCLITVRVASPPSRLTISILQMPSSVINHSAISMRDAHIDTYKPIDYTSEKFPPYKVYEDPQGVSYFAEINGELLAVVFSETSSQARIVEESLEQVLSSIKFRPKAERQLETAESVRLQ